MKQIGNLAVVCARRQNVLLQVGSEKVWVHVGAGPERDTLHAAWDDDDAIGSTMESSQLPLIAHRFQKPDIVPQCVDCFVDIAIAGSKGMDAIKIPKAKNQFFPQKLFQLD